MSINTVYCLFAAIIVTQAMIFGCSAAQLGYRRMIIEIPIGKSSHGNEHCSSYTINGICNKRSG